MLALLTRLTRRTRRRPTAEQLADVEGLLAALGRTHARVVDRLRGVHPEWAGLDFGDPAADPIGSNRYPHPDAWAFTKVAPDTWVCPVGDARWRSDDEVRDFLTGTQLTRRPARPPWPMDTTTSEARRA